MATGPTYTTSVSSLIYAAIIEQAIQLELRPYFVIRQLTRKGTPGKSQVFKFNTLDNPSTADIQSYTESSATDLSGTYHAVTTTGTNATAAIKGIIAFIEDLARTVSVLDLMSLAGDLLSRSMLEQYETDAIGTASPTGFTNITGDTTNPMSVSRILAAISAMEQRNNVAPLGVVLHPKQSGEIRADIQTSASAFIANPSLSSKFGDFLNVNEQGRVGNLFGAEVFHTSVVPTSDTGAGRAAFVLAKNSALGEYTLWSERVETWRKISQVGEQVVATSCYGFAVVDQNRAQLIKSKA